MTLEVFDYRSPMPASAERVFDWHKMPGAFDRFSPPWVNVEIVERTGNGITDGARVTLQIKQGPLSIKWLLEHKDYVEGEQFCDTQIDGPFASWQQLHRVEPDSPVACHLRDKVEYEIPAGPIGALAAGGKVHFELEKLFKFRHRLLVQDLELAQAKPLNILVTGSTGLIGSQLVPLLTTQGHKVVRLLRSDSKPPRAADPAQETVVWNYEKGEPLPPQLESIDVVVHLAGDNIGAERWSDEKKRKLVESRVDYTAKLVRALKQLQNPPSVFISGSAIGFYGDRGEQLLDETSSNGSGFLADLCKKWEAAASEFGDETRVVMIRTGVVLSPRGGALNKMLPPFKMGAGGPIGSGDQYFSWIDVDDAAGAIYHCITNDSLSGPVNLVAPSAVTNGQFASILGTVINRSAIVPMPAIAAKAAFGQFADECLLASQRVVPKKLKAAGYKFRNADLETSLRHLLGRM